MRDPFKWYRHAFEKKEHFHKNQVLGFITILNDRIISIQSQRYKRRYNCEKTRIDPGKIDKK